MNWNLIRSYLMVAEHGSTLSAARHLAVTQSTVSRQLSELESQLNIQLFDRRKSGLVLTEKGQELLTLAQQMDSLAGDLQAQASQFSTSVSGTVRISASEVLSVEVLPFCLADILFENPELQIEIVASNEASNLLSREADIALRMFATEQQGLISKHLLDASIAFYAHKSYLEKHGTPKTKAEFALHKIIGFDVNTMFINGAKKSGIKLKREDFPIRSDSILVQNQCAMAGLGLVVMQDKLAANQTELQRLNLGFELPSLPLYLVAQSELRSSRKLRVVYDGLSKALTEFYV